MTRPSRKERTAARRAKRAEKARLAGQIVTPEGVPIHLPVAGVGVRMAAQLSDILITAAIAISLVIFLLSTNLVSATGTIAIVSLLFFAIRVPYYVVAELLWNGQTLGKKWMKIKVVAHDGGALTTHALVLRNLMKEAEVFLPATLLLTLDASTPIATLISLGWIAMALAVPFFNRHRRRLGDFLAGTHVIRLPQPILLRDLALEAPVKRAKDKPERFKFLPHQLDHYGRFELQTLETLLRANTQEFSRERLKKHTETQAVIVEKIRKKIGYADPVVEEDLGDFLRAFYNAQRAYLEQRQLFGDRRANKHHATSEGIDAIR